jgi:hypothetical protein
MSHLKQNFPLGSLFVNMHSYRAPDVVRVVGYTKCKIIVEDVPTLSTFHDKEKSFDEHHSLDRAWLASHPVVELTKGGTQVKPEPKKEGRKDDENSLLIKGENFFPAGEDFECDSCEY